VSECHKSDGSIDSSIAALPWGAFLFHEFLMELGFAAFQRKAIYKGVRV
jgi:hypothetical protein